MKMRVLSLNFKKNQPYRNDTGSWKTIRSGEMTILELGEMNHFGTDVLVGINSKSILDIGKVKRHISSLEAMGVQQKINWFEGNFPDIKPLMIATSVISGLHGKSKSETESSATVVGSFDLNWGN